MGIALRHIDAVAARRWRLAPVQTSPVRFVALIGLALPAVMPRCLPANPSRGNDYSWVGAGIHLNIEQNDWLGHAVSTEAGRLILEEVLGFNISITEAPMVWVNRSNNPLSRIANGSVDGNFEAWKVDYGHLVNQYSTVARSTYDVFKVCSAHGERTRASTSECVRHFAC
jgi:hypothetical protein